MIDDYTIYMLRLYIYLYVNTTQTTTVKDEYIHVLIRAKKSYITNQILEPESMMEELPSYILAPVR